MAREMKDEKKMATMDRRTFMKASAAASYIAIFHTQGCASFPKMNSPVIDYSQDMVVTNANIIDVVAGKLFKEKTLVISNGHIARLTDTVTKTEGAQVIDIGNRYIIPGLIDGHCHTTLPSVGGFNLLSAVSTLNQIERNYYQHIVSGTTTVRDTSAFKNFLRHYTKKIDKGTLVGPRVYHPGTWMNVEGSHPGDIPPIDVSKLSPVALVFMGDLFSNFKDTKELKKRLDQNLETNPSFIKLSLDDESLLCGKVGKNRIYSEEHIKEIIKFSEKHDLPLAGHVHYKFGFDKSQEIPLQHFEHMVGDGPLSDKDIMRMAKNNMTIVPTMVLGQMYAAEELFDQMPAELKTDFVENEIAIWNRFFNSNMDRYSLPAIQKEHKAVKKLYTTYACTDMFKNKKFIPKADVYYGMLVHGVQSLLKMKDAGILIGCGTDAGVPFACHGTLWREMELYSRIGFKNDEILRCATLNNARILRVDHKIGSIEANKYADLVVLSDNPLEKIEAIREPELVFKEGKILFSKQPLKEIGNKIHL